MIAFPYHSSAEHGPFLTASTCGAQSADGGKKHQWKDAIPKTPVPIPLETTNTSFVLGRLQGPP